MIKRMAVFCGARDGKDPAYNEVAKQFGQWLAQHKIELVYGGGSFGLMGDMARAVLANGGVVHGVITTELADRGALNHNLPDIKVVPDMDARKKLMMELADGMVAFPGGFGTLEEVSEAASWTTIGDNQKPVAIYNFQGFYDSLKTLFIKMNQAGFLEDPYLASVYFSDDFDAILKFMNDYQVPMYRQYHH